MKDISEQPLNITQLLQDLWRLSGCSCWFTSTLFKYHLTQLSYAVGSTSPEPATRCRRLGCLRADLARQGIGAIKFLGFGLTSFALPTISLNKPKCILLELKDFIVLLFSPIPLRILNSTASWSVQSGFIMTVTSLIRSSLFMCSSRVPLLVVLSSIFAKKIAPTTFQNSMGLHAPHCAAHPAAGITVPSWTC